MEVVICHTLRRCSGVVSQPVRVWARVGAAVICTYIHKEPPPASLVPPQELLSAVGPFVASAAAELSKFGVQFGPYSLIASVTLSFLIAVAP